MSIALWIIRGLLALAFLLTGWTKTFTPMGRLGSYMVWVTVTPTALVRWIGIAELVGAIGLILPVLTGMVPWLTIAAAIGLAVVMVSAAVFHAARKDSREMGLTLALLVLILFVVVGHVIWVPLA
ncbi:hypothetical protein KSD_96840 [Ktedonobacter sp. SOSP1-85]|uniref:DoxX family protein n=1 Tax=Ktedonobacter sp. SOSP1-85 TaxID=2778367 RepID=UPI0019166BC9|nr:DoxX family protein [Ktedonobacter sp. SOSP1-85]GHO81913.1 hypothetical protein KSD_96840 [Ktedonobacter sp. SOSP1-85]